MGPDVTPSEPPAGAADEAPPGGRLHPLTLRFADAAFEEAFLADHGERTLQQARVGVAVGGAMYAAFGALDAEIMPNAVHLAWLLRFGVVCPYAAALLGLTFLRGARRWYQPGAALLSVLAAAGIVAMIVSGNSTSGPYHAGLLLVPAFTFTGLSLRFVPASLAAWCGAAIYLAALPAMGPLSFAATVCNVTFIAALNVLGMATCYAAERTARRDFVQRHLIERQAERLADALARVKVLTGLLPVCAWCRKVRDDDGYWQQLEGWVTAHSDATFSHGMCPACAARYDAETGPSGGGAGPAPGGR